MDRHEELVDQPVETNKQYRKRVTDAGWRILNGLKKHDRELVLDYFRVENRCPSPEEMSRKYGIRWSDVWGRVARTLSEVSYSSKNSDDLEILVQWYRANSKFRYSNVGISALAAAMAESSSENREIRPPKEQTLVTVDVERPPLPTKYDGNCECAQCTAYHEVYKREAELIAAREALMVANRIYYLTPEAMGNPMRVDRNELCRTCGMRYGDHQLVPDGPDGRSSIIELHDGRKVGLT